MSDLCKTTKMDQVTALSELRATIVTRRDGFHRQGANGSFSRYVVKSGNQYLVHVCSECVEFAGIGSPILVDGTLASRVASLHAGTEVFTEVEYAILRRDSCNELIAMLSEQINLLTAQAE